MVREGNWRKWDSGLVVEPVAYPAGVQGEGDRVPHINLGDAMGEGGCQPRNRM